MIATFITVVLMVTVIVFCVMASAYIAALLEDRTQAMYQPHLRRFEQRRIEQIEDAANQEIQRLTHEAFDQIVTEAHKARMAQHEEAQS